MVRFSFRYIQKEGHSHNACVSCCVRLPLQNPYLFLLFQIHVVCKSQCTQYNSVERKPNYSPVHSYDWLAYDSCKKLHLACRTSHARYYGGTLYRKGYGELIRFIKRVMYKKTGRFEKSCKLVARPLPKSWAPKKDARRSSHNLRCWPELYGDITELWTSTDIHVRLAQIMRVASASNNPD